MNIKNWWKRITKQTEDIKFEYRIPLLDAIQQLEIEYTKVGYKIII